MRSLLISGVLLLAGWSVPLSALELTGNGEIIWQERTWPLADVRPAGTQWKEHWQGVIDAVDWRVEVVDDRALRLTRHGHRAAAFLIVDGHGRLREGADEALAETAARIEGGTPDGTASLMSVRDNEFESVLALWLDGFTYTPIRQFEYHLEDDLVIIHTGRGLNCTSDGDSAGLPVSPLMVVIDNRIVGLDGSDNARGIEYQFNSGLIAMDSRHLDVTCGEPDALRLTMNVPDTLLPDHAGQWEVVLVNHDDEPLSGISVSLPEVPDFEWSAAEGTGFSCQVDAGAVDCSLDTIGAAERMTFTATGVAHQTGDYLIGCVAAMTSEGRVADENCWGQTTVSATPSLVMARSGPDQADIDEAFTWMISVENTGEHDADGLLLIDTLPGGVSYQGVSASSGWDCTLVGEEVHCDRDLLVAGETQTLGIEVTATEVGRQSAECRLLLDGTRVDPDGSCHHSVQVDDGSLIFRSRFEGD